MVSSPASDDLPEVFPPTLREVMLRGRWIAMLLLCLAVAAVFAWLGQWQLARAIDTAPREEGATEQVMPIQDVAIPGEYLTDPLIGQRVEVSGTLVPSDFVVVASRYNGGVEGYWVTAHLRAVDPDASLAVAVGWAASRDDADAVAETLAKSTDPNEAVTLTGRIVADEGPVPPPKSDPWEITRMSPAALLSRWQDIGDTDVYRQFVVADDPMGGLADIDSPAPDAGSSVNWLNIFYAAEWVIFAGFAFYLWYRLAKDAWEKELEELEELEAPQSVEA
ncbi:SURF1 family protein [Microbacterium binotii]|uniref:SURF1 family protein n=1 Tax=Microbacterium binotii TaxID=462710 RepID=UPI001F26383C|nr:SURF1 family cytochrome oxidase biogenesis protein [Microbacterium binotii]UIN32252.1 SURF1 family protein [Microbacterium binotii]